MQLPLPGFHPVDEWLLQHLTVLVEMLNLLLEMFSRIQESCDCPAIFDDVHCWEVKQGR